jgi:putative lipoprotein
MKLASKRFLLLFVSVTLLILAFSLTGCNASSSVTGTVTYLQRIALPPDAVVTVQLQDVSVADAPAAVIGEQIIAEPGQVPIEYEVRYEYRDIKDAHSYSMQARIEDAEGKLLFISDISIPVLTQGHPTEDVEIIVIPVSTSMPNNPATLLGDPDGMDTFDNANNWTLFDAKCFKSEIKDGKYVMTSKGIQGTACWEVSWPMVQDYYVEVTIETPEDCNSKDRFGLFFRAPDNNRGYFYELSCESEYSMTMWDGQGTAAIVEADTNPAISTAPSISNRVGVLASADNYYLYVNGQFVDQGKDSTFIGAGKLGFFVRAATDQGFTARFDDLAIWLLDDAYYPPEAEDPDLPDVPIESPPSDVPTVTAMTNVNVRSGPGAMYPIYGTVEKGTTGEVVGISPDNRWWAVKVPTSISGNGLAWVAKDYASLNNPQGDTIPTAEPPLLPPLAGVPAPAPGDPWLSITEVASARSGPGIQYPIYGAAPVGSKAKVVGISEDREWWAVELPTSIDPNGRGWIYKDFVYAQGTDNVPTIEAPRVPESIIPTPPQSGAAAAVTLEPINVRSGPSNKYTSYGQIPIGTEMAIVGKSADGEYWVVKIPKSISPTEQGWVAARYCEAAHTQQVPVVQPPLEP